MSEILKIREPEIHVVSVGEQGPPGGSGSSEYIRPDPVPSTVGGVTAGSTFNGTVEDALDALFYPYQAPAFTSFSFPQTTPLEVGDSVAAGSKLFTWATSNSSNVAADSVQIIDVTGGTTLYLGGANDGSESLAIGTVTKSTDASHIWRISATNTHSASFTRDFTVTWYWRRFYGHSTDGTATEALVEGLQNSSLTNTATATYSFSATTPTPTYKYIAYPTAWGLKTSFKDTSNNIDVAMQAASTISITNAFGQTTNYYVHRTTNQLGGAINIAVS